MLSKCLFPAAGYGTRFLPATKAMPKEMLPIVNKPLIECGVEESLSANLNEISIVTGRNKRAIEDHFDINYELEHKINNTSKENNIKSIRNIINKCTFSYTRQKQMNGLGDAVLSGKTLIGNNPFAVILADDLCINLEGLSVLSQMVDLFYKHQCSIIAIEEVPRSKVDQYGIVSGIEVESGLYKVQNMVEKPSVDDAESNLAIIGRYILTPDIFSYLEQTKPGRGGEIQLTDAILKLVKNKKVLAYKFKGRRFDCGSIKGYIEATNYFYKNLFKGV